MSLRVEFARSLARWREEEILLVMFREVEITEDLMDKLTISILSMIGLILEAGIFKSKLNFMSETASTLAEQLTKTKIKNPKMKNLLQKYFCLIFSIFFSISTKILYQQKAPKWG